MTQDNRNNEVGIVTSSSEFSYCSVLEEMLKNRVSRDRSGRRRMDLHSLSTLNNISVIRNLAMSKRLRNTLEIGMRTEVRH